MRWPCGLSVCCRSTGIPTPTLDLCWGQKTPSGNMKVGSNGGRHPSIKLHLCTHKGVHTDTCMHTDACTQIARTYRCVLFFIPSSHFVDCGLVWSNLQEKVEKPGAEQGGLCVWKGEISRQWHSREHILLSRTLDWFSAPTPRVSL